MTERCFPGLRFAACSMMVLVALAMVPGGARAAGFPPAFVMAGVPVDATADTAIAARAAGQAKGTQDAFRGLLERLTAPSDWSRLPQPDYQTILNMEQDFEVADEHSSAVRYIASYTFRFSPHAVRRLLSSAGLRFTELASKPVVVVPVLKAADGIHLWDDQNPWRDAWKAIPGKYGLVPWVAPAGDSADAAAVDASTAAAPSPEHLETLSHRYGDGDVVVAMATASVTAGEADLDITVTRYAPDGTPDSATTRVSGARLDATLYQAGVTAAQRELETAWKKVALAAGAEQETTLDVSVPIMHPGDWGDISQRLAKVPSVRGIDLDVMTRREVRAHLRIKGNAALIALGLAQQDLVLVPEDGVSVLRIKGDGAGEGN